jgi:hypothetical protein
MPRFISTVTQSGADTSTAAAIETGILPDGRSGLSIFAMEVHWTNAEAVPAADWECNATLSVDATFPGFTSPDEIARISWGVQNTAGVAVAVPYDPTKSIILIEPRVTVQPLIYAAVVSQLTSGANVIQFRIYYEVVKLTEMEVLRLLVGGA